MADKSVGSGVGGRIVPGTMFGIVVSIGFVVGITGVVLSVRGIDTEDVVDGTDASGNAWFAHPAASTAIIQRKKRTVPERSFIQFRS